VLAGSANDDAARHVPLPAERRPRPRHQFSTST
jgi:hypothetical protein